MEKDNFLDLCDVPWWDRLETDSEKNEYCLTNYGITYEEFTEIIESDLPIKEMYAQMLKKHSK